MPLNTYKYKPPTTRLDFIDIIRGLAIVLMIYTHFYVYTITPANIQFSITNKFASNFCVPLFYFIIGYVLIISIKRKESQGLKKEEIRNYILIRVGLIYLFGTLLNLYQVGPNFIWHWSTLQIIALGYLLSFYLRNTKVWVKIGLVIAVLIVSFVFESYYSSFFYLGEWDLPKFLLGVVWSGGYPVIPWIVYFIVGMIMAKIEFTKRNVLIGLAICGSFLVGAFTLTFISPMKKYPASLTYNFLYLSLCILLFFFLYWLNKRNVLNNALTYPLRIVGRYPMTLFLGHIIVYGELIKLFRYIGIAGTFTDFIIIYTVTFALITVIGYYWSKSKFKYGFEWLMRKLSYKAFSKE